MSKLLPGEKIKRKIITIKDATSNPDFGSIPEERTTEEIINYGIVIIDKPKGPTSHQVADFVKQILKIEKSGHTGTLDPRVTGVLPVALGNGTKIVEALLKSGKEYVALMHLHKEIPLTKVKEAFKKLSGTIKQLPPIKSAVKRVERPRTIYYTEILDHDSQDILFKIGCEAGTYIRKYIHDLGKELGCGAHMSQLRRTKAGPFTDEDLITLHDLEDAMHYYEKDKIDKFLRKLILPIESAIENTPKIWVLDTAVEPLSHGSDLKIPGIVKIHSDIQIDTTVAIMTLKDELVAIGIAQMDSNTIKKEKKGLVVRTNRVFMDPGVYLTQN